MTIGKFSLRALAMLFVFLSPALLFLSCNRSSSELPFELLDPAKEQGTAMNFSLYRVVIPTTCSSALLSSANDFCFRLNEATGVRSEVVYDHEAVSASEHIFEIMLGNTDRPSAKKKLASLRQNDYLCYAEDGFAVLGGKSEQATLAALDRFSRELLPYVTSYAFLPSSAGFSYTADYPIEEITLNGFALSDYTIVYTESASGTQERLAQNLQKTICKASGYDLLLSSEKAFAKDRKQIFLSLSPELPSGNLHLLPNENGLLLCAPDTYGLSVGADELCRRLLSPSAENKVALTLSASETLFYEKSELSLASLWHSAEDSDSELFTALSDQALSHAPDVILAPTMSELQREILSDILGAAYSVAEDSHLFYKSSDCRWLSDLSAELGVSAALYQIGSDSDGFLLLTLAEIPEQELPSLLQERTLPLLILLHCKEDQEKARFPMRSSFERVLSESYLQESEPFLFEVYADRACFATTSGVSAGGYRSLTVSRTSVLFVP